MREDNSISEVTRRNIFDEFMIAKINWSGRFNDCEFLGRLYDLEKMPSTDFRIQFSTAYLDIFQHMVNNNDWDQFWVFTDGRFNLLHTDDDSFLRFLTEMVHPVVRPDPKEASHIVSIANNHLRKDGWRLTEGARISDQPLYIPKHISDIDISPSERTGEVAEKLGSDYVNQQIARMETAISEDLSLALGTAKEFLETICKTVLSNRGVEYGNNPDIPELVKLVRSNIELLPSGIEDEAEGKEVLKRTLSNLGSVVEGVNRLRGLYGTGHGKDATNSGPQIQRHHARLAVNSAIALGIFILEAHWQEMG